MTSYKTTTAGYPGRRKSFSVKWARLDSNQEPRDYESHALTVELQARVLIAAIVAYEQALPSFPLDLFHVAQPRPGVKVGARQLGGET
jgi:hypothetical protein